ncbi:MAG: hypothetical protein EOO43_19095, partial [Flavobacterium sp.]
MNLRNHLKNVVGFTTKRKIVVIESDDWGSIRTKNKLAYENMLTAGLDVDKNSYTMHDALESNQDLEGLFTVLTRYKDSNGRYPVFTPMYIMGNPNFELIRKNGCSEYEFEHFLDTCKRYPNRNRVSRLIQQGIESSFFLPELHGREHINAPRWMRLLQRNEKVIMTSFDNESFGASAFQNERTPPYLCTFTPEFESDLEYVKNSLQDAVEMFNSTFGYSPKHFIEPDDYGPLEIEEILQKLGVKFLLRAKITRYSNYNNTHTRKYFRWVGQRNKWNQIYLTRNCTFEPHRPLTESDVVGACLNEIQTAFTWRKPAIVISHRASYVGSLSSKNQKNGLKQLDELPSDDKGLYSLITQDDEKYIICIYDINENTQQAIYWMDKYTYYGRIEEVFSDAAITVIVYSRGEKYQNEYMIKHYNQTLGYPMTELIPQHEYADRLS